MSARPPLICGQADAAAIPDVETRNDREHGGDDRRRRPMIFQVCSRGRGDREHSRTEQRKRQQQEAVGIDAGPGGRAVHARLLEHRAELLAFLVAIRESARPGLRSSAPNTPPRAAARLGAAAVLRCGWLPPLEEHPDDDQRACPGRRRWPARRRAAAASRERLVGPGSPGSGRSVRSWLRRYDAGPATVRVEDWVQSVQPRRIRQRAHRPLAP